MTKKHTAKPEISYNHETGQFRANDEWITDDHLWALWNDVGSADYTQGAFNKIIDLLQKGANQPPTTH
jgi:hypothetical protein